MDLEEAVSWDKEFLPNIYFEKVLTMDLNDCYDILQNNGFIKRSAGTVKAFFRIYGDGVLQIIQFKKEHNGSYRVINIGLISLFGKIEESWLTCLRCIPRYEVLTLEKRKAFSTGYVQGMKYESTIIVSEEEQAEVLCDKGIAFFNKVSDQAMLIKGVKQLENGRFLWNDTLLFPAFLACGDWQRSDMVLSACIEQHSLDSGIDIDTLPEEDADRYLSRHINVYRSWERKKLEEYDEFSKRYLKQYFSYLEHIRARDEEWRKAYLAENYTRNMEICKKKHFVK